MTLNIGITCYPTVGGSGVVATELGKVLAERGHNVHFITSSLPFRLEENVANIYFHEVEVNQYSVFRYPPYDLALASKMAEVAKRESLDILHVHYAVPHAISAHLAKEMVGDHLKIVTTLHGTDITVLGYDPSLKDMIRFGINKSDYVTAVSQDLVHQTQELLQTSKPIETVYNFVDQRLYYPKQVDGLKAEYGISEHQRVVVHVSNFRRVKRVTDVIDAFRLVREKEDAVLLLIGEGPDLPVVDEKVKQYGLEDVVYFLGNQKRINELLSMSDVKWLLSEKESFGLTILEAMACRLPVIGTDIGGIPEVIEDDENGYIVPLGDTRQVAEKTLSLFQDEEKRQEMGRKAELRTATVFAQEEIVAQYERVYHQALSET
ncbi:N-acetyl-alpha-D-glucosaminyl L-malate synthase BshA [Texcoconibacillus texcoconensis]|uniref:N-acetyl-alpha-D-glucosaminyl L-malate synthase BshA n=1 Tax=Texcoconibacillus texcoconensis TaxID=1095777 RepID=A0A840QQ77_9BACI|nr:N-acetyl-alpha-D-glucosaminyl L-malate synthase BshA [Texcoconibacillus texcoconensis]MBB5173576.1 N-acetyl-alpha-D-glucosaminyl L-malate synthase BshA [Texcoconibacillus texcoconensis]